MKISSQTLFAAALLLLTMAIAVSAVIGTGSASVSTTADAPDVIIDAGHGGVDGGAVGVTGAIEKEINLDIALRLKQRLEADGLSVLMIRSTDISLHDTSAVTIRQKKTSDLKARFKIASAYPDTMFVSIHQNSFSQRYVHGTIVYYGVKNPAGKRLAELIRDQALLFQSDNNKTVKQADGNLFLLSNLPNPCVLVECGFLSNPTEEAKLKTPEYRQQIAKMTADGILIFLREKITN